VHRGEYLVDGDGAAAVCIAGHTGAGRRGIERDVHHGDHFTHGHASVATAVAGALGAGRKRAECHEERTQCGAQGCRTIAAASGYVLRHASWSSLRLSTSTTRRNRT